MSALTRVGLNFMQKPKSLRLRGVQPGGRHSLCCGAGGKACVGGRACVGRAQPVLGGGRTCVGGAQPTALGFRLVFPAVGIKNTRWEAVPL